MWCGGASHTFAVASERNPQPTNCRRCNWVSRIHTLGEWVDEEEEGPCLNVCLLCDWLVYNRWECRIYPVIFSPFLPTYPPARVPADTNGSHPPTGKGK